MAKCFDRRSPADLELFNGGGNLGNYIIKNITTLKILATTNFNSHNLKLLYFT